MPIRAAGEKMLDIKFIRENAQAVKTAAEQKRIKIDIDGLLQLDEKLLEAQKEQQALQSERNAHSKKIPKASAEERPALIQLGKEIGEKLNKMKPEVEALQSQMREILLRTPNIPNPQAPVGKDDSENVVISEQGELPQFDFQVKDHVELLQKNNWAEFERLGDICGSRSYALKNEMVQLEMAMHRLAMDILRGKGFDLVSMPSLVREAPLTGTGQFPEAKDQVYQMPEDDLFLSGTSEVQLNSFHSGEILEEKQLPIRYAGYSACFRREAGSYGRDVRGLIRVHQFMKVEQYILCKADHAESEKMHQDLLKTSQEVVEKLELPYRILEVCTGDMGPGKYRMFDIECWVPSEKKYRETHSCSNLTDWQARRTNLRYRDSEGKVHHCFTLNNTAIATPRIIVSFLENHQNSAGGINLPEGLRPYLGGLTHLGPA